MQLTIIIALVTAVLMVLSVLVKPYIKIAKLNVGIYWIICLMGAFAMIVTKNISFSEIFCGITQNSSVNPLKILTLFWTD